MAGGRRVCRMAGSGAFAAQYCFAKTGIVCRVAGAAVPLSISKPCLSLTADARLLPHADELLSPRRGWSHQVFVLPAYL